MLHFTSTTDTLEQVEAAAGLDPAASADTPENGAKTSSESGDGSGPSSDAAGKPKPTPATKVSGESNDKDKNDKNNDEPEIDETDDEDGDEAAAAGADAVAAAAKPKGKGGFQKRIDKLSGRNAQLEDELRQAHQNLMEVNRRLAEGIKPAPVTAAAKVEAANTPTTLRARPNPDDPKYTTYNEYLKDNGDWTQEAIDFNKAEATRAAVEAVEKFKTDSAAERTKTEQKAAIDKINEGWLKAQDDARAINPDFDTVFTNNTDPRAVAAIQSPVIRRIMFTHPLGGHLAYWLGSNVDRFVSISQLSPDAQLLELGKVISGIETQLETGKGGGGVKASTSTPVVKKSGAPRPARTASGKASGGNGRLSVSQAGSMSFSEYKASRQAGKL